MARSKLTVATAESCTGGLIASLMTDVEGCGGCFDRAFVVYTNQAKADLLGVDLVAIETFGAVSAEIAARMAEGALARSEADIVVAVTGFAGPAGPRDEEGLVFLAAKSRKGKSIARECHFGPAGRDRVREPTAASALEMLSDRITE